MGEKRVCLGVIAAPHGVRGLVKIKAFTEQLLNLPIEQRMADEAEFAADITLRFELESSSALPPVTIEFSEPDAQGQRLARRSDETGSARISAGSPGFWGGCGSCSSG